MPQTKDEWIKLEVLVKDTDHKAAVKMAPKIQKLLWSGGFQNVGITWFWGLMPNHVSPKDAPAASSADPATKRRSDSRRKKR